MNFGKYSTISINCEKTAINLKCLRIKAGLRVEDVRKAMGFNQPKSVYRWEDGTDVPSAEHLVKLAELYKTTVDDLVIYNDGEAGALC